MDKVKINNYRTKTNLMIEWTMLRTAVNVTSDKIYFYARQNDTSYYATSRFRWRAAYVGV